jgi:2-polyprenyl-6-methoxyphenol hydroxylase-like FAD-dependent oxidoreductase
MKTCIIIGGGTAGTVSALVLSKLGIKCTIYELRDTPTAIGGAINLTPNALKLLESLGVEGLGCRCDVIEIFSYHTGSRIGELPFRGPSGHGMRVIREVLLKRLLDAVEKAGVSIVYGSKLVGIEEDEEKAVASFENGTSAKADFVLGCDGMYSAARMKYVEPERKPIYTGIASAYAIVDGTGLDSPVHFKQTCLNSGRLGSLLTTYCESEKELIYIASIMQTPEQDSKDGWKARGMDNEATASDLLRRYGGSVFRLLPELMHRVETYNFYPVYKLSPGGEWSRSRVLLLGDAAHGVRL